jgi:hypothetical protein
MGIAAEHTTSAPALALAHRHSSSASQPFSQLDWKLPQTITPTIKRSGQGPQQTEAYRGSRISTAIPTDYRQPKVGQGYRGTETEMKGDRF